MGKKRLLSASLLLASLTLIGAGCGQSANVNPSVGASAENQRPAPHTVVVTPSDTCGNPYYPFKAGLAITYGITSSAKASADSDYTLRVLEASGASATIRSEMSNGVTADVQVDCAAGTVAMKGAFDLGAAMEGTKVKTTVISSSGTFMPANVAVGTVWSNAQTMKVETTGGPAGMGPITTTTEADSKAIAQENVTVPAGSYDALKVEVTRTTTMEGLAMPSGVKLPPGMKIPTPPPTVTVSTEWWVKGIGMVKSVTKYKDSATTVEAKSVTGL